MRGIVNEKQLLTFLKIFQTNKKLIYKYPTITQYLIAIISTFQQSKSSFWDELLSIQKVFFYFLFYFFIYLFF